MMMGWRFHVSKLYTDHPLGFAGAAARFALDFLLAFLRVGLPVGFSGSAMTVSMHMRPRAKVFKVIFPSSSPPGVKACLGF